MGLGRQKGVDGPFAGHGAPVAGAGNVVPQGEPEQQVCPDSGVPWDRDLGPEQRKTPDPGGKHLPSSQRQSPGHRWFPAGNHK